MKVIITTHGIDTTITMPYEIEGIVKDIRDMLSMDLQSKSRSKHMNRKDTVVAAWQKFIHVYRLPVLGDVETDSGHPTSPIFLRQPISGAPVAIVAQVYTDGALLVEWWHEGMAMSKRLHPSSLEYGTWMPCDRTGAMPPPPPPADK